LQQHQDDTVLNIGSLSLTLRHVHPHIINLDIAEYPNIDVVADAHALPFKNGSIDIVLLKNVIEHVRNPAVVMSEIHRVLKPGGYLYAKIPFLQPFHAVPDHFQGFTPSGIDELTKAFKRLQFGVSVGPGSMLSWMLREYLAILCSCGSMKAYRLGLIVFGWLTFWIKYSDLFFRGNLLSGRLASAFYGLYMKA